MTRKMLAAVFVVLMFSASAYAERQRPARSAGPIADDAAVRNAPGVEAILRCLAVVDLTDDQKLQMRQLFAAAKPELTRLAQQLRESHQLLVTLAGTTGANACDVGGAYLQVEVDRKALEAAAQRLRRSLEAVLTPDQRLKLEGCLAGSR